MLLCRARRVGVALLIALAVTPSVALAYTRAEVQGKPGTYLYWTVRNITYYVNRAGCQDLPLNETVGAIRRAFFSWASPSCTDFFFNYGGLESADRTNLTLGDGEKPDGKNLIIWREDAWPPPGVTDPSINKDMPAVTTLIYKTDTGFIADADIDLNGYNFFWTTTDDPAKAATDIENIVAHEIGHLLGLGHSDEKEATMYGTTVQAELKKRTLEKDDLAGTCFVYPFSADTPPGPGQGTVPVDVQGGCAVGGRGERGSGPLTLLLALLVVVRRRRG